MIRAFIRFYISRTPANWYALREACTAAKTVALPTQRKDRRG